jgi:chromosome segregation ATPase
MKLVLTTDCRRAEKDLKGLKGAVDMVSQNRSKFPDITDVDLDLRRKFVTDMLGSVKEIKNCMDKPNIRQKLESDEQELRRVQRAKQQQQQSHNSVNSAIENENTNFLNNQKQETMNIISQQDGQLDILGRSVDRLGEMSKIVNQELSEQNNMLNNLEDDLDDAGNKMNVVMASLSKLLKTKNGCQIWTIVILFFILAILVALIIWT